MFDDITHKPEGRRAILILLGMFLPHWHQKSHIAWKDNPKRKGNNNTIVFSSRRQTHHSHLCWETHDIVPGETQDMRQVKEEVDESAARRRQVGLGEEDADEEALGDCGHAEDQQEHEDHWGVTVLQHFTILRERQGSYSSTKESKPRLTGHLQGAVIIRTDFWLQAGREEEFSNVIQVQTHLFFFFFFKVCHITTVWR